MSFLAPRLCAAPYAHHVGPASSERRRGSGHMSTGGIRAFDSPGRSARRYCVLRSLHRCTRSNQYQDGSSVLVSPPGTRMIHIPATSRRIDVHQSLPGMENRGTERGGCQISTTPTSSVVPSGLFVNIGLILHFSLLPRADGLHGTTTQSHSPTPLSQIVLISNTPSHKT